MSGFIWFSAGHRGYADPSMGAKGGGLIEGELVAAYLGEAHYQLIERGHIVRQPDRIGGLADQAAEISEIARANPGAKMAVILAHVNSAGPEHDYSAHLWHCERPNDRVLASCLATEFGFAPLSRAVCVPATRGGWTYRSYSILDPFRNCPPNVSIAVFEPCFLSNEAHRAQLLTRGGLVRIGGALADALDHWLG